MFFSKGATPRIGFTKCAYIGLINNAVTHRGGHACPPHTRLEDKS
jgi:hypothetical protein